MFWAATHQLVPSFKTPTLPEKLLGLVIDDFRVRIITPQAPTQHHRSTKQPADLSHHPHSKRRCHLTTPKQPTHRHRRCKINSHNLSTKLQPQHNTNAYKAPAVLNTPQLRNKRHISTKLLTLQNRHQRNLSTRKFKAYLKFKPVAVSAR